MKKIKYIILTTNGRSGSEFFQSLLDGHSQIVSFPGTFDLADFYRFVCTSDSSVEIVNYFIQKYGYYFNSKINISERLNQLGVSRKKSFFVDKKKFKEKFIKNFNFTKKKNIEYLMYCLHHSYYLAKKNKNFKNIKLIFIHLHHAYKINELPNFNYEVIYTYRNPIAILNSGINSFLRNKSGNIFNFKNYNFFMRRMLNEIKEIKKYKKKIYVIKLEDIHKKNKQIMKKFCKIFKLKYEKILFKSTFFKMQWWGDSFTKNYLKGVNPSFTNKINLNNFYSKDIILLEEYLSDEIKFYRYKFLSTKKLPYIYMILPMKIEILLWSDFIKRFKVKQILLIPVYWFKRISYMINKKKVILPKNILYE